MSTPSGYTLPCLDKYYSSTANTISFCPSPRVGKEVLSISVFTQEPPKSSHSVYDLYNILELVITFLQSAYHINCER